MAALKPILLGNVANVQHPDLRQALWIQNYHKSRKVYLQAQTEPNRKALVTAITDLKERKLDLTSCPEDIAKEVDTLFLARRKAQLPKKEPKEEPLPPLGYQKNPAYIRRHFPHTAKGFQEFDPVTQLQIAAYESVRAACYNQFDEASLATLEKHKQILIACKIEFQPGEPFVSKKIL